jgi:hypothetical protein
MESELSSNYMESVKKQFLYYKKLGEGAIEQLEPSQLFETPNENSNSIAVIVKHLWGNMLSRWTDFLNTDGEKATRDRDGEFENNIKDKEELTQKWGEGWECLLAAIDSLHPTDLLKIIYIRNEGHTVMEALNRQLCHYSYHVGQIVYAAKSLKLTEWNNLSIPKNKSRDFNAHKFSTEKQRKHFTCL